MSVPLSVEASASSIPEAGGQALGPGSVKENSIGLRDKSFSFGTRNYFHSFHNKEPSEDNLGTAVKV